MKVANLFLIFFTMTTISSAEGCITDVVNPHSGFSSIEVSENLIQNFNLGFSNTTGNTNNLDLNAKYDFSFSKAIYNDQLLKIIFDSSLSFTKTNYIKSNEEYLVNLGLEQDLKNQWLSYLAFTWLRNLEFKNYNNKTSIGLGLGKDVFFDGEQSITVKLGTSYNREDYANLQSTEDFSSLNEYIKYNNQLNKISKLYLKTGALQNFEAFNKDYEILAVLGVSFKVGEKVNLSIEEEFSYDNLPPIGFEKTDTKSMVRLGYKF